MRAAVCSECGQPIDKHGANWCLPGCGPEPNIRRALESSKSLESKSVAEKEGFEPSMELLPAPPKGWYPSGGTKA